MHAAVSALRKSGIDCAGLDPRLAARCSPSARATRSRSGTAVASRRRLDLPVSRVGGRVWEQDATTETATAEVINCGKYNWVRLWFLSEDPRSVDQRLTDTARLGGTGLGSSMRGSEKHTGLSHARAVDQNRERGSPFGAARGRRQRRDALSAKRATPPAAAGKNVPTTR